MELAKSDYVSVSEGLNPYPAASSIIVQHQYTFTMKMTRRVSILRVATRGAGKVLPIPADIPRRACGAGFRMRD
jgi:hypothetical protein